MGLNSRNAMCDIWHPKPTGDILSYNNTNTTLAGLQIFFLDYENVNES